ncbi:phage major capsid protein [Agrobacterium tumefaciens]|uniref:phage major capsid protein n=1 Tax=Agrobacterium tumefaciens TaxID=358 RepID=UPI0015740095|nr:phage major capsid protein [Agrobacterium tumefaciens]NSZ65158.1 phage major capsid protein [Agrobacterium tumefaciens]NTA71529.1 phage major capsid protein [Agrobacterium tumefaciens]WIE40240.1 phage major capsid protein [Agrobacterium tumefaciens]
MPKFACAAALLFLSAFLIFSFIGLPAEAATLGGYAPDLQHAVYAMAGLAPLAAPRAISFLPHANANPAAIMAELQQSVEAFKTKHSGRVDTLEANMQKALDDLSARVTGQGINGSLIGAPEDPEYSKLFASFVRKGQGENEIQNANASGHRASVNAAMSAGSAGDGGYLAPTEWDRTINKALINVSPMRRIADVVSTSVRAYSTVWNTSQWGSGWVGETAARPQTSTTDLKPLIFDNGEIYAMPAITQQLLDDAQFNVEEWVANEIADTFAKQEGIAFISGDGVNKPRGLLTYVEGGSAADRHPGGNLTVVNSGSAAAITPDALISFTYSLPAPYRNGASWLMNSTTAATIALMKDGQGNYLWRPGIIVGQPASLLGYPVEIDENMPNVAANATPIAFGNFKAGYLVNDRIGQRVLRDPYTSKPYVLFYITKRVGGGVKDPNAIRLMKVAANP